MDQDSLPVSMPIKIPVANPDPTSFKAVPEPSLKFQ